MADISGLLKTISQELRKAQNAFFNRKFDEALAIADGIAATLESAKAQDPAHVQVKTYENQLAKLRKDVASRTGKPPAPAAQILKSAVYSDDWKELSQWEDYAGTPRFVTRREIYAQVAANVAATCRLFTVYITKELRSDQTWSALAGNVMFAEEMDPSNLGH